MRDNLPNMLRSTAKEWREENKVVAVGATRYDAALDEAANAIEELQATLYRLIAQKTIKRRIVYRGAIYNAIEGERVNHLDGILSDRYKDGFHDGLKRALEILGGLPDAEEAE